MIFIGIDNGTTGKIAYISSNDTQKYDIFEIPVKKELSYTKTKQYITRIDYPKYKLLFEDNIIKFNESNPYNCIVGIERPMVNPGRFKSTMSGIRCLEATLILIEELKMSFRYIDSKEWQKKLLPHGLKKEELKSGAVNIASRLYPMIEHKFKKDADAILIAHYLKMNG